MKLFGSLPTSPVLMTCNLPEVPDHQKWQINKQNNCPLIALQRNVSGRFFKNKRR